MDAETHYADSDGVSIAYQVRGEGAIDLVFVPGFVSHLDLFWEEPATARLVRRLSSFARLILYDKRGQGLSDRLGRPPTLEESMGDLRAVMDAAASERAALLGISEGGPMCALFAATHPERVSSLVLYGTYARLVEAPDYPAGLSHEAIDRLTAMVRREWGGPVGLKLWAPSAAHDPGFRAWWARLLRQGTSPRGATDLIDLYRAVDARDVLPVIAVPTLVLHRSGDRMVPTAQGRYLAEHIPDARYVELPGSDHLPMAGDLDALLDEVEEFLVGTRRAREPERALATVLFTDIVGSTERAGELGDRRWRDLLAAHDAIVRRQLQLHGGREVKTMGDGFLATFDGPARAIRAARSMRDGVLELGVSIRAGIHTGEIELTGDDIAGMAVNIGARVGARAGAGEVLVSSTVKELVVGSGIVFAERGAHELKGVPGEWRLFAVADEAPTVAPDEAGAPGGGGREVSAAIDKSAAADESRPADQRLTLPSDLISAAEAPLVGRDAELAGLRRVWEEARDGALRAVLLAGEPGIGKTACAAALAREAYAEGAAVLYGRCDEVPIGPYQPFVEALDRAFADRPSAVDALSRADLHELERVLPGLAAGGAGEGTVEVDPEHARRRLFEAMRAALRATCAERPTFFVLDDLHWADQPTAALLLHLVRGADPERPAMLVATYRDTAVEPADHPLALALSELRRRPDVSELALGSLSEEDVLELASQGEPELADPALGRTVHSRTGGNPLFVVETLRDLAERRARGERGNGELPVVVRDVSDGRVARLGPSAAPVLRAAAVAGAEFELADVEAVLELDAEEGLSVVEHALAARLLREHGEAGRYAFSHALVRDALYEATSSARRARLHAQLGLAQAERGASPAEVAEHLLEAAPLADADTTADWVERAATEAMTAVAYEDAADLLGRALDRLPGLEARRRGRLLLSLGAALDSAGRRDDARETFLAAAAAARETGDRSALARAALGHKGLGVVITVADPATVALLEEALSTEADVEPDLRARLLAALALEIHYEDPDRSRELSAEAVDLARAGGSAAALAETLSARHTAIWTAEGAVERLAVATEMHELAAAAREQVAALQARNWRVLDLLELGRIDEVEAEVEVYADEAAALRLPRYGWYVPVWRSALATLRGEFELAERLAAEAERLGREAQDANAATYPLLQRAQMLLEQRRFEELDVDGLYRFIEDVPAAFRATWLGWLAWVHAELGEVDQARAAFDEVAADGFANLPRGVNWHAACEMAEACALLGDRAAAAELMEILRPHARLNPVVGRGVACYGPVSFYLGRLATALDRSQEAVAQFETALAASEQMGARPRAALSRLRLGEALAATGEAERGARETERAREAMQELGVRP